MLVTVTTAKDTVANLRRFVAGNLARGVDHLIVFLDDPHAEGQAGPEGAAAYLRGEPHVTVVGCDDAWWGPDRPDALNARQRINANVARSVLAEAGVGDWLFHVDADEVVDVDRDVLDALPEDVRAVRLAPLEAVARTHWEGEVTHFKRLLDEADLTLLHVLGVIDRPHNGAYFHGHVDGKAGIRPAHDVWHTLHHPVDADRERLDPVHTDPRLRVLHHESYDGEEFVRKWTAILAAGPMANFRAGRAPTAVALDALIRKGLSPEAARPYLMRIFERTTLDDFDTLRDLGLLEEPGPGTHRPTALAEPERTRVEDLLAGLAGVPKRVFHPGQPADRVRELFASGPGGGRRRGLLRGR
jgi:hypothetical protein